MNRTPTLEGKIKTIGKGFGFIRVDKKDYFFHRDDFHGHWYDLDADFKLGKEINVTFEEVQSKKGPRAGNVRRADFPNQAV